MLQRAFGFEPRRLSSATGSHRRDNENGNELLDLHTEWSAIQFVEASERSPTCIINPLLGCLFEKMPKSDKLFYFATPDRLQQLATDEKAPWRGLLLSQPPAQGFTISWQCACVVEDDGEKWMDHQYGFLWNTHGVTIADLVRELARVERVDKVKEEGRPRCGREVWGLCWRC